MATTKSKSLVWKHFERFGEKAKCSQCISGNILSCSGGSTSALRKHLFSVHNIKLDDAQEAKGNTFQVRGSNWMISKFLFLITLISNL